MDLDVIKKLIKKYEQGHTGFVIKADEAERYYRNETDVLFQKRETDSDNKPLRNADNRIPRNFHGLIVNQKAAYMFTAPPLFDTGNKQANDSIVNALGDEYRKYYPMKEYEIGVTAPPMHPNCRSCTCPYFDDEFTLNEKRAARKEDGKTYYVPADTTYEEWKSAFVDGDKADLREIKADDTMNVEEPKQVHMVIDGQNLIGEYTPSSDYDHMINDIVHQQGFDGKPQIVPYEEFKRKMEDSNFYAERTYSAADQTTLDSYRQELYGKKGDSWYLDCSTGGSQYGQGMYCASSYDITDNKSMGGIGWEMMHYQEVNRTQRGNPLSYTESLTLDKTAKILELPKGATKSETHEFVVQKYVEEYVKKFSTASQKDAVTGYIKACDDISKLTFKESEDVINALYDARAVYATKIEDLIIAAHKEMEDITDGKKYHGTKDPGVLAAEMGYDAIKATGHGESGSYTVILNRTKIIFCEGGSIYGN